MDRPLAPPIYLRSNGRAKPLTVAQAYHHLVSFLETQASRPTPTTHLTQLERLSDALGVSSGLLSAQEMSAHERERTREEREEARRIRKARREMKRLERMEREERKQDEEEALEKQVEGLSGSDEEIGEDEGNGYVQEGSSGDEGAGLPDTANDEVEGGSDVDMVD
ncbi:hypothetical protein QFC24_002120 [Naganishia onofrii]|uniref:Uncharacterized protein n=1 Tax=Naganishia onofrii TaxID=1851511 RepID=A0ACC2XQX9_9TREE|nr:hypothetical protein QFC24_002120 [Naganishia onofrii]